MATRLPDTDAYGRGVDKNALGANASYVAADGKGSRTFPASSPYSDAYAYAALLADPPANYTGEMYGQRPLWHFARAVSLDNTLATATRVAVRSQLHAIDLAYAAGDGDAIAAIWADMKAGNAIPAGDQAKVHSLALKYGIPGI